MIRALIIDRDGVCVHHSNDLSSPFYYILHPDDLILKPKVREAFALLAAIRRHSGLKVYLATKQRCISKGLISRMAVDDINKTLEQLIGFSFDGIYVEESASNKWALFTAILRDSSVRPSETHLIDDSYEEALAYQGAVGGRSWDTGLTINLYNTVRHLFSIS
jgi:histidinol phosphatase-like enzyme